MIDQFASRLSIQKIKCFTWKADPHSLATAAMQEEWSQEILYAFPVLGNAKSTFQINQGKSQCSNMDNSSMTSSTLVSKSSCTQPFLTSMSPGVLKISKGECSAQSCLLVQSFPGSFVIQSYPDLNNLAVGIYNNRLSIKNQPEQNVNYLWNFGQCLIDNFY